MLTERSRDVVRDNCEKSRRVLVHRESMVNFIVDSGKKYSVNLELKECYFGHCKESRLPCAHACA